jgi:hypothetical protein
VQFSAGIVEDSKETFPSEGMLSDALTEAVRAMAAMTASAITMIFFIFVFFKCLTLAFLWASPINARIKDR